MILRAYMVCEIKLNVFFSNLFKKKFTHEKISSQRKDYNLNMVLVVQDCLLRRVQ